MATYQLPIVGWQAKPDTSGECFPEPFAVLATNDAWDPLVFRFGISNAAQPTVRHGFFGIFTVPQNYTSAAVVIPMWTASLTTGNVVWDFDYRTVTGDDTTSLDQAGTEAATTVTDAAPSAAFERNTPSIAQTDGNFAAGETVEYFFARDGADAADTMAGAALLFELVFQYTGT